MKFLVTDDEFIALTKITSILSKFGDCDVSTNGGQALEMFMDSVVKGELYDLMTIDSEMPDINGLKVLQLICKSEQKQNLHPAKKIIVSAEGKAQNVIDAAGYKCEFLEKPVMRETLINKLIKLCIVKSEQGVNADA